MTPERRVKHRVPGWIGVAPAVLIVGGLSLLSLWGLIVRSLRPGAIIGASFGIGAWQSVLSDGAFWSAVWFTARTSIIATAISVLAAIPLGRQLQRGSSGLRSVTGLPIPVPHLVVASIAVLLVGPGGLTDRAFGFDGLMGSRFGWGVIVVYAAKEIPFLTILVATAFNPATAELEEAVRGLGGGWWDRWRTVLLPSIAQPLGVGSVVVAAFVIGATEVPLAVGPVAPDALTTYGLTLGRLRGPIARADAAVALTVTTGLVALTTGLALIVLRRASRVR